jgi:hypothetical protein
VNTVAQSTRQQSASIENLVTSASDLSKVAATLTELTGRFKVQGGNQAHKETPKLTVSRAA